MKFLILKKRSLIVATIMVSVLALAILGVAVSGAAGVFSNQSIRNHPINSVETTQTSVALTFDAAWGTGRTEAILAALEEHNVKATFFVTGAWAERNPDVFSKLVNSGRVEIGTHSNTHPHMTRLRSSQIQNEISTSLDVLQNLTGTRPALFRAPYGEYSDAVLSAAANNNLQTIGWNVDARDWQDLSSYDIVNRVMTMSEAGSIIRLHNDGRNTAAALGGIIQGLKNRGLSIVPVSELIHTTNYTIDQTGRQHKAG